MPTAANTRLDRATKTATGFDFKFSYTDETDANDATAVPGVTISIVRADALNYETFVERCYAGGAFKPTISAWQDAIARAEANA